jgi:hypothetical protein
MTHYESDEFLKNLKPVFEATDEYTINNISPTNQTNTNLLFKELNNVKNIIRANLNNPNLTNGEIVNLSTSLSEVNDRIERLRPYITEDLSATGGRRKRKTIRRTRKMRHNKRKTHHNKRHKRY